MIDEERLEMNSKDLVGKIAEGSFDEALANMYGREALTAQRERIAGHWSVLRSCIRAVRRCGFSPHRGAPRYAATTLTISGDACWLRLSIWMLLP